MRNESSAAALVCVVVVAAVAAIVVAQQRTHDVAAEVLAFERDIEAAVVRGDVPFVDAATAPTFTFTHGDGWTTGVRWTDRSTKRTDGPMDEKD